MQQMNKYLEQGESNIKCLRLNLQHLTVISLRVET